MPGSRKPVFEKPTSWAAWRHCSMHWRPEVNREKYELAERFAAMPANKQRVFLEALRQQSLDFSRLPIVPAQGARNALSYAQSRQWFLWQLEPDSTAYHVAGALRLRGPLDEAALRASFAALVSRHESLRTVFRTEAGGQPMQVVQAHAEPALQVIDLSEAPDVERRACEHATQIAETPFDLSCGPLLRLGLIRLGAQEHLLVVVMHHIVSDGWSMQLIVNEFAAHYRGRVLGKAFQPAPLPIQYADYAQWQRSWLEAGELERQLAYWKTQLGTEQPVLHLPADHARRADGRYRAGRLRVALPPTLIQPLQQRAQSEGATLFMVHLAAFQALLQRYTGQADIRVGVPTANRHRPETEGVVGFFVNTQVLRSVVEPRASLRQLLAQVKAAALGAQAHQDLPFEQLVQALQPQRSLGQQPLFQVMFNHQREDHRALHELPGLTIEPYELPSPAAQFELTLDTVESAQGAVHTVFSYAAELFEPATIERMAKHYEAMLRALAERPDAAIGDAALLDDAEQEQLRRWGVNAQRHANTEPVHRLIERQVKQAPQATALVFGDEELSYDELNRRANRLAHRLIALSVGAERRVGVALTRSIEMVVGLLAILKAGGAYVPLDPNYPAERLEHMVRDSGITLFLTDGATPASDGVTALPLDTLDLRTEPDHDPVVPLHGQQLAYVIYTSGSTGRPKGIGITHAALAEHSQVAVGYFALTPADRMLQFSTINFDGFVEQLFPPLVAGAAVVLRGPELWDSETFHRELIQRRISIADLPTAYWHLLAQDYARQGRRDPGALRQVQATGEAMPPEGVKAWRDAGLAQVKLLNTYGPTETVVTATAQDCGPYVRGERELPAQMPIGHALAGRQAWVLDAGLNPVPPGVAGELYIGGALLARGYHGRAGLSAERFVADPFGDPGGRLYRTGDVARWNAEGQLEYLGRADHQVKVRGFRIELGEIEAQLLAQPGVREAVVVAHEGQGGTRLVGYVAGAKLDAGGLKAALVQALPDYMVPSALVVLDALPKNANGKIDRHALPAAQLNDERAYEAPQGETEQAIAGIWADVLGVPRVGRHDNFFELGGHSLLALSLLERLRAQGMAVPVRNLFQHPELAAFAHSLSQPGTREVAVPPNGIPTGCEAIEPAMLTLVELDAAEIACIVEAVPGGAANIQDIYPLAPLQEGILFHHVLQAGGDAYLTPHLLRFPSRARLERFIDSVNQVIARHDILRTAVWWEGLREPVQVVARHAPLHLQWLPEGDPGEDTAQRLWDAARPGRHRMDVRRAPMLEAVAAHDAARDEWLLMLASHHLVDDHTTLDLIVQEIALIEQGRADELPIPVPFRRFVAQARLGMSAAEHEAFFKSMLGDVEEPTAPFGLLDVQGDGRAIEEARMPLATELSALLRRQAQRHGVSAATLFHLAWALVLAQATGQDDVVFGTVLFGRMQGGEGAERGLGLFINTLPIRVRLGVRSVGACLRETQQALAGLLQHEHASLALAQQSSALAAGVPLFSSLLNYRYGRPAEEGSTLPLPDVELLCSEERTNYPLMLSVDDLGEGYTLVAHAVPSAGAARLCEWMQAALRGVVQALVAESDRPACDLPLLSAEQAQQAMGWGVAARRYPDTEPVHRMIERQVQLTPNATALVFGDAVLTYGDLNRRANRLAHRLIALGVGPDVRVGMAVERSIASVVGLLAILKAGGAYLPLDPDHPADRLAGMVREGGIHLLLTQSGLRGRVPAAETLPVLELDRLDLRGEPAHDPQVPMHGQHLAYVLYTSGSTGRPKGVAMPHSVVSQLITWQLDRLPGAHRTLLFASPCFDVAFQEVASGLASGGALVQTREEDRRDFPLLLQQVEQHGVERVFLPFAVLALFAESALSLDIRLPRLRQVITAGEQLKLTPPLRRWLAREGQCRLVNQYGPTESHVVSDFLVAPDAKTELPPIGSPASNAHLRVLDRHLQPVPAGVPGELYIGSTVLARGYLHRPALTAERFVADPFDAHGARLYRTGDRVRWNDAGQLEYLGRIDHQVKVRGFRVELGEIEAQLLAQPEVREAVVVAQPGSGGVRLVAYVSPQSGQSVDAAVLRERLGRSLPEYMVPSTVMALTSLPLNPNGKVDRKALPEPEPAAMREYEAPQGVIEEALAAVWADVLGMERVGRQDSFFELGGHSLAVMELAALMRQRHGIELPLRAVFDTPTLAHLAAHDAVRGAWGHDQSRQLAAIDALLDEMTTTVDALSAPPLQGGTGVVCGERQVEQTEVE
jgi:amino acid adenylation domain-containing protein